MIHFYCFVAILVQVKLAGRVLAYSNNKEGRKKAENCKKSSGSFKVL